MSAAQLAVARRYGFASWTRLKRHVEVVTRYSRFPDRMTADAGPAEEFLRLACLTYADDQPERWDQARRLLDLDRGIVAGNVYVAAATADAGELRRVLAADPGAARREGGPYRWEPLFYLAYARHDPEVSLERSSGPRGCCSTRGPTRTRGTCGTGCPPRSPCSPASSARVSSARSGSRGIRTRSRSPACCSRPGADPNDGQALYNRMFEPGNDHLELLLEFGLGDGDGGPWRRRLGDALDCPGRDGPRRARLGDHARPGGPGPAARQRTASTLTAPFDDGVTVTSMAATTGHPELIGYLVEHGAPAPDLTPPDAFVAAALAADRARMGLLLADHPALAGQLRAERPALITWAAACGSAAAVEFLVELGFDVNARGRTDVPSDQPWQTALHKAAEDGNLELARTLLRLGADPDIRDHRFDSTPLGWARTSASRR